jgi:amyloid beta precursor protein binding protein 1
MTSGMVTPNQVATNFFLHPDGIGRPVAEEAVKYLGELNPSVEGLALVEVSGRP